MDGITIASKILAVYSLAIMIIGTLTNILTLIVCSRKKLRSVPTFVFMSFMVCTDTVALYFWNLDHFLDTFYGYMIEYISIVTCKTSTFLQLFSLQSSAWLLVVMSFERYLSVQVKNWRVTYFNSKKAAILSSVVILLIFFLNLHLFFTIDYSNMQNFTGPGICFYTDMFQQWKQVHTYIYSIVPFIILVVVNSLLIYRTVRPEKMITRSNEEKTKRRNISFSIVAMTVSFIVLTLPNAIAGGYYIGLLFQTKAGTLGLFVTDALLFSYHSFNFVVFVVSNKKFAEEFREIIFMFKRTNKVSQDNSSLVRNRTTA